MSLGSRRCQVLAVLISLSCVSCGGSGTKTNQTSSTITVTITPNSATVGLGGTAQFTCEESGSSNTNVTWEVNDVVGGNQTYGTISKSGLYTAPNQFVTPTTVTLTCLAQANSNSRANVPITLDSGVTVSVSPASVDLNFSQTQQFTATVTGSSNTKVNWQAGGVSGGNSTFGTITSEGLYTAPSTATSTPFAVSVAAIAQVDESRSGTASVVIHDGISVQVSPNPITVPTFGTQQFTATLSGTSSTEVTWEVNGVVGGSSTTGRISNAGLYTAPSSVPTSSSNEKSVAATVTVTAVSQQDSTAQANVVVTILPPNQAKQQIPIALGVSGGNANDSGSSGSASACCAGTLGALVSRGGNQYILSASHVLARGDAGAVGDSIIQPGLTDTDCSTTNTSDVATLSQFINLENPSKGTLFVDAALAQVIPGQVDSSGAVLQLGATSTNGQPANAAPHAGTGVAPSLGLAVAKSGRSTGLTCASVTAVNAVVNLQYQKACGTGDSFSATFSDLVIVGGNSFSADGDSGSLLVTQDTADPVALLIASSDTQTVAAPVSDVLSALAGSGGEQPVFVGSSSTHTVAGCSLTATQSASSSVAHRLAVVPTEKLLSAALVRDSHSSELLSYPEVRAIGVVPSLDQPGEPALLLVVSDGKSVTGLPQQVDGFRTRIVHSDDFLHAGVLSENDSVALANKSTTSTIVAALPEVELARARRIQSLHVSELMKKGGVQGVALTSSADDPEEPALLVLVIRGSKYGAIPAVLDGLRTRISESSAFGSQAHRLASTTGCHVQPLSPTRRAAGTNSF